jgi:malonyl CoA-acyl carrier protein transacylase
MRLASGRRALPRIALAGATAAVTCLARHGEARAGTVHEVGPGRVLAGLMRRIQRRADFTSVNRLDAIEKLARTGPA